jgi:hypothetical protein
MSSSRPLGPVQIVTTSLSEPAVASHVLPPPTYANKVSPPSAMHPTVPRAKLQASKTSFKYAASAAQLVLLNKSDPYFGMHETNEWYTVVVGVVVNVVVVVRVHNRTCKGE